MAHAIETDPSVAEQMGRVADEGQRQALGGHMARLASGPLLKFEASGEFASGLPLTQEGMTERVREQMELTGRFFANATDRLGGAATEDKIWGDVLEQQAFTAEHCKDEDTLGTLALNALICNEFASFGMDKVQAGRFKNNRLITFLTRADKNPSVTSYRTPTQLYLNSRDSGLVVLENAGDNPHRQEDEYNYSPFTDTPKPIVHYVGRQVEDFHGFFNERHPDDIDNFVDPSKLTASEASYAMKRLSEGRSGVAYGLLERLPDTLVTPAFVDELMLAGFDSSTLVRRARKAGQPFDEERIVKLYSHLQSDQRAELVSQLPSIGPELGKILVNTSLIYTLKSEQLSTETVEAMIKARWDDPEALYLGALFIAQTFPDKVTEATMTGLVQRAVKDVHEPHELESVLRLPGLAAAFSFEEIKEKIQQIAAANPSFMRYETNNRLLQLALESYTPQDAAGVVNDMYKNEDGSSFSRLLEHMDTLKTLGLETPEESALLFSRADVIEKIRTSTAPVVLRAFLTHRTQFPELDDEWLAKVMEEHGPNMAMMYEDFLLSYRVGDLKALTPERVALVAAKMSMAAIGHENFPTVSDPQPIFDIVLGAKSPGINQADGAFLRLVKLYPQHAAHNIDQQIMRGGVSIEGLLEAGTLSGTRLDYLDASISVVGEAYLSREIILPIRGLLRDEAVHPELQQLGVAQTGQAGIEQLKTVIAKERQELFEAQSNPEFLQRLIDSSYLSAVMRPMVRFDSSSWGQKGDAAWAAMIRHHLDTQASHAPLDPAFQPVEVIIGTKVSQKEKPLIDEDVLIHMSQYADELVRALEITQAPDGRVARRELFAGIVSKTGQHVSVLKDRLESIPENKQAARQKVQTQIDQLETIAQSSPAEFRRNFQTYFTALAAVKELQPDVRTAVFERALRRNPNFVAPVQEVADASITTIEQRQAMLEARLASLQDVAEDNQERVKLARQIEIFQSLSEQYRQHAPQFDGGRALSIDDLASMRDFIEHTVNQETFMRYFPDKAAAKEFEKLTSTRAIDEQMKKLANAANSGTVTLRIVPTRGLGLEASGHIGDACWASKYDSIANQFPNFTGLLFVQNPGTPKEKLVGSSLVIAGREANSEQQQLIIRGLNPIENFINHVAVDEFYAAITKYVSDVAARTGAQPAIVIDGHSGGAATNRPLLHSQLMAVRPGLQQVHVRQAETTFNGYDLTSGQHDVFRLQAA